jgi:hypothetical protein
MDRLGEGVVGERLLDLDGLTGLDELVHVGGHVSAPGVHRGLAVGKGEC